MRVRVGHFVVCFFTASGVQCGWAALGDAAGDPAVITKSSSQGKSVLLASFVALAGGSHPPAEEREVTVALSAALCGLEDKGVEPRKLATELLGHVSAAGVNTIPVEVARHISPSQVQLLRDKLGAPAPPAAAAVPPRARGRSAAPAPNRTASGSGASGRGPGSRPGSRNGAAHSEDGTRGGSGPGEARQVPGASRRASAERGKNAGGRWGSRERGEDPTPRPGTARSAAAASSALDIGDTEQVVLMSQATDKEERRVSVRSFKFEARIGEAKLLHAALAPYVSPALAELMFSDEFKKHCAACDKLSVRICGTCVGQLRTWCIPCIPVVHTVC